MANFLIYKPKSSFLKLPSAKRQKTIHARQKRVPYGQTVQICAKKTKHCATLAGIAPPPSGLPRKAFVKMMYKEHVLKFLEGELQRWNVQVATGAYTRTPRGSLLN
jgi:hypothetical protein